MKRTLTAFLSFIVSAAANAAIAQPRMTISGTVLDKTNNQAIKNATVDIVDKNGNSYITETVQTNRKGFFSINIGDVTILSKLNSCEDCHIKITANGYDDCCESNNFYNWRTMSEATAQGTNTEITLTKTTPNTSSDEGTLSVEEGLNTQPVTNSESNDSSDNNQQQEQNQAKEPSNFTNNLISAAGIGATGIGGMMATSALTEQYYDETAENEMREYVGKFRCDYGTGTTVVGGTFNNDLPGGNELIDLYTQYATLANDLKVRKDALGLKPGIESEVIIDKAESGLYDNAATGVTGGNYASIARAIQDPTGTDAQKWKSQLNETSDNLETGATVAGVGAIGSAYLNIKNNSSD